jgi:hypothetical protein
MGPKATYEAIIVDLRSKAANAAKRNKPTMWAYYLDMARGLEKWFAGAEGDGYFAGAALALSQRAVEKCPRLGPQRAARLWAMGVYARRILRAWGVGGDCRVSLDWLHRRAGGRVSDPAAGR